ncbi:T-cell surface glycoprotein CD4-like [Ranitomeya imitator]|uniref:T-cell surface glycoprotein CD4-like n=1 Tax=Ranitomeya imitator TaxID=111125 RepID=UPI0037E95400
MKKKLYGFCFIVLYLQTCLSSALRVKILAEVGKHVSFPCNKPPNGDIEWFKEQKLLGCRNNRRFFGPGAKDQQRYNDPCHEANDLVVSDLRTADSGTYTCKYRSNVIITVELFIFQVSIVPSANLLPSEDLELNLTPSSVPGLKVSWKKDGMAMSNDPKLEENNVQSNAVYECRITMAGGNELIITTPITVFGFHDFPSIVYASDKSPVTIPWIFNFNIRKNPMSSDAHVEEGSISYSSQILSRLSVTDGAASWPRKSDEKEASEKPNDLSVHLTKPKSGKYQMEILLKIGKRRKELRREVCVAGLTVSNSESAVSMDTKVPLHCAINCMESNKKLCWHQMKTNRETCGRDGQSSVNVEVTAGNETKTAWTCSVTDGKNRIISVNVTLSREGDSDLTGQSAFLDLSNSRFWAAVGVGIFILILIVVIITLVIARHRRMRRARQRAWLLENLHQKRRCECKGFAPQRLKTTSDYI